MTKLTAKEHRDRHIELHKALDELITDFIMHTGNLPSKTGLMLLMEWSAEQAQEPTESDEGHEPEEKEAKAVMKFEMERKPVWVYLCPDCGYYNEYHGAVQEHWENQHQDGCNTGEP